MRKIFERYKVLILFLGITVFGLLIHTVTRSDGTWLKVWGALDVSFAVAMGVIAFLAYLEFIQAEDEIKIYFEVKGTLHDTHLSLLRKDCTRSEINGILTMPLKEGVRFHELKYMKNRELLQDLHAIQKGKKSKFVMPMSAVEFEQFLIV
jgi:hypothetical protein